MRVTLWVAAALGAAAWIVGCGNDEPPPATQIEGPPAPEWAHAAVTRPNAIILRWTDVSQDEVGFSVERSLSANAGFALLDTLGPNRQEFVDDQVVAGARYYYRVFTRGALGTVSGPTPVIWADAAANATPVAPADPYPPNKGFDLDLSGFVTLTWTVSDPDGDAPLCTVSFGEARNALAAVATGLTAGSHTLADTLALTRFYFWRISATDDHGATALSPIWSFGTSMEQLPVPEGYAVMGDCGRFFPADPARFCPSGANPVFVPAFTMDKYEVSNQLFAQFLNELLEERWIRVIGGQVRSKVQDTLFAQVYPLGDEHSGIEFQPYGDDAGLFLPRAGRENHPVIEVSWHGANRFARHFGRRLPTEAEWEKAARGTLPEQGWMRFQNGDQTDSVGIGRPLPWGTSPDPRYCNYLGSGDPYEVSVGVGTTPAGFYDGLNHSGYATLPNASSYGIFDLAGNAAEWCWDAYVPYSGGASGNMKSVRGGGWRSALSSCQTFWREAMPPDSTDNLVGFRTVSSE